MFFKSKSLAFKQNLYFLTCTGIVLVLILFYSYVISKKLILKNVMENAATLTDATVSKIDSIFLSSAKIPENLTVVLEYISYSEENLKKLLSSSVGNNQELFGGCIAFEPYAFDSSRKYYALYCFKNGDKIDYSTNIGSDSYPYFYYDWYQIPEEIGHSIWTEPYFDEGGGNIIMSTYSVPFYKSGDGAKVFNGVATADISLLWLQKIVSSIKILKSGYGFLISKSGTIITHPNHKFIMNETIFSIAEERKNPQLREIGRKMIKGEKGFARMKSEFTQEKGWIYYAPLSSNGWSIAVVLPEAELFADLTLLYRDLLILALSGLLILSMVIAGVTNMMIRPIRELVGAASEIGTGDFNVPLPAISSDDEIGRLTKSFSSMQSHLKQYIANLKNTTAAKEKMESELKIAHDIQMSIIPKTFPPFPDRKEFDIYAVLVPARMVGGDLYDFFLIDEENICFAVGDVSGKGMPASLFMAITKTLLRAKAFGSVSTIVEGMNNVLCKDNPMSMFVTFFLGILNTKTGMVSYCNAGHNPPYLIRKSGEVSEIQENSGMPLGVMDGNSYKSYSLTLSPGDRLFLYTDGVTEAENTSKEFFEDSKLCRILNSHIKEESPKELTSIVLSEIKNFTEGAEQADDITILTLIFNGNNRK